MMPLCQKYSIKQLVLVLIFMFASIGTFHCLYHSTFLCSLDFRTEYVSSSSMEWKQSIPATRVPIFSHYIIALTRIQLEPAFSLCVACSMTLKTF